jgi:hypothetical protein
MIGRHRRPIDAAAAMTVLALWGCAPSVRSDGPGGGATSAPGSTTGSGGSTATSTSDWIATDCDGCLALGGLPPQPHPCPGAQELFDERNACICGSCSDVCGFCTGEFGDCEPCAQSYCGDLETACAADKRYDATD